MVVWFKNYGIASSQLDRIRKEKIKLTVCVDKVAASGGYMMACVGDKILAKTSSHNWFNRCCRSDTKF